MLSAQRYKSPEVLSEQILTVSEILLGASPTRFYSLEEKTMSDKKIPEQEEFKPKGTIVILLIFLLTIIILWGSVYVILLDRGVTL